MRLSTSSSLPSVVFNHATVTTLLLVLVAIAATVVLTPSANAQTIPLGTITVADPAPCPTNFYSGMTCRGATIDCTNADSHIDNISLTIGYVTQATTPKGTIVFFTGGSGTASDFGPTNGFADSYVGSYMIVYVEWASAWENSSSTASYRNILSAACRPATLLHWVNGNSLAHPSGAMCAQGKSAGSAAIAYAMSWYGAGSYLTNVELLAGPVLSKIDDGCNTSPPTVNMCPSGGICTSGTINLVQKCRLHVRQDRRHQHLVRPLGLYDEFRPRQSYGLGEHEHC